MKQLTLFLSLFTFTILASAQAGNLKGSITSFKKGNALSGVKILFYIEYVLIDSVFSDEAGNYFKTDLPSNAYRLVVNKKGYHQKEINNIVVQAKQVGKFNFTLTKGDSAIQSNYYTKTGNPDPNGVGNISPPNYLLDRDYELATLSCVDIVTYKVPLLDNIGASSSTVVRSGIARMPGRTAASIATTIGGVQSNSNGKIISIRGARKDANAFYIDGIRTQNLTGLPKGSIQDIRVITGGIPANYGDLTGGVVSITTRGYNSGHYYPPSNYSAPSSNHSYEEPFYYNHNTESYEMYYENEFLSPRSVALSTFSIDVDKASYSNVRRMLNNGALPNPGAVRIEELINYFEFDYPSTAIAEVPISIHTELGTCPWNKNHQLLKIGMKGYEVPAKDVTPSNFVFLIDVSGSMSNGNKLPLLKNALKLLTQNLRSEDKISMVVYAGSSGTVLEPTKGDSKNKIYEALERLESGGSTNGAQGIDLAYKLAKEQFIENGNNRVILATDGDFNVGTTSNDELERLIVEKRETGIYLTTLGFGMGNYKDDKMELLADKGNGNYFYIDNIMEAKKVLVTELFGTLYTIAKDVKLQLEFNPTKVKSYRLIGYENRLLAAQDFSNDSKDAGELGSGHTVTALYELIPANSNEPALGDNVDSLRYQKLELAAVSSSNELVQVKCRYKLLKSETSTLKTFYVDDIANAKSVDFKFASAVAAYGMLLRNSEYIGTTSFNDIYKWAQEGIGEDTHQYRSEFLRLVHAAETLSKLSVAD